MGGRSKRQPRRLTLPTRRTDESRSLRVRARSFPLWHVKREAAGVVSELAAISARQPWRRREIRFCGVFSTSLKFLTVHPYRALLGAASGANEGSGSVAIGTAAAIVRANLPELARRECVAGSFPFHEDCPNADYSRVCPARGRRRYQQYVDVTAAVRADLRDHVFPH